MVSTAQSGKQLLQVPAVVLVVVVVDWSWWDRSDAGAMASVRPARAADMAGPLCGVEVLRFLGRMETTSRAFRPVMVAGGSMLAVDRILSAAESAVSTGKLH